MTWPEIQNSEELAWFVVLFPASHGAAGITSYDLTPVVTDAILEENGDIILQENTFDILQEA